MVGPVEGGYPVVGGKLSAGERAGFDVESGFLAGLAAYAIADRVLNGRLIVGRPLRTGDK